VSKRAEVFLVVFLVSACAGASPSPSRAGPNSTPDASPVTPDPRDIDRTSIDRGSGASPAAVAILDDGSGDGGPPDPEPPIETDV
jgi:hypothetical protein